MIIDFKFEYVSDNAMNNLMMQLEAVVKAAINAAIQNPSQTVTSSASVSSNPGPSTGITTIESVVADGGTVSALRQNKTDSFPMSTTSSSTIGATFVQVPNVSRVVHTPINGKI